MQPASVSGAVYHDVLPHKANSVDAVSNGLPQGLLLLLLSALLPAQVAARLFANTATAESATYPFRVL